jgi:hypothetical protein
MQGRPAALSASGAPSRRNRGIGRHEPFLHHHADGTRRNFGHARGCVAGTVTNVSPGTDAGAGEWSVTLTTPLLFTNLVFQPGDGGTSAAQGDFAFVNLTVSAVPEPSTWAMMILGFFGVGFMAYRRKATRPTFRLI